MWHPDGVYFGWAVGSGETPALAVLVERDGHLALAEIMAFTDLEELAPTLAHWTRHDVDKAFCADVPLTFDGSSATGERRIDRLYRKLIPSEFEQGHWVSNLTAVRVACTRALQGARAAHGLGIPLAETNPRASLAWMGARREGWRQAVREYSAATCASEETHRIPLGIVRERCRDLWNSLLARADVEDIRKEPRWANEQDIDAVVCAIAARYACHARSGRYHGISGAVFPWYPAESLIGARGTYVLLGRDPMGQALGQDSASAGPDDVSRTPSVEPKRAA